MINKGDYNTITRINLTTANLVDRLKKFRNHEDFNEHLAKALEHLHDASEELLTGCGQLVRSLYLNDVPCKGDQA